MFLCLYLGLPLFALCGLQVVTYVANEMSHMWGNTNYTTPYHSTHTHTHTPQTQHCTTNLHIVHYIAINIHYTIPQTYTCTHTHTHYITPYHTLMNYTDRKAISTLLIQAGQLVVTVSSLGTQCYVPVWSKNPKP